MSWLVPVIYVVGWIVGYRFTYRFMANSEPATDSVDRVMLSVLSALAALFWPVMIPMALLHRFVRPVTKDEREQQLLERQAELDAREARIKELERELDIRDNP